MTGPLLPSPAERRLARELAEIRSQLETLKGAARATQLGNSTLFGAIPVRDGSGAIRQVIGQQQDGTFGVSAHNGPPPDRPSTPIATPSPFGAIIEWNGQLVSGLPADFSHCNVYVAEVPDAPATELTLVGSLSRAGQIPVGPLEPGRTYYAKLRAASTSKDADGSPLLGAESFETTVVAGAVVATTVLAGIVDDLALAAEAVTNAKLAANAVDGTKIAPDSIASPHIIARAIQALHVAADAIQAGAVAADVITGRELRALSILADHINTNAINAGHLQAGIIDADKLSAILILATRIILGDPTGARLEIDALGLDQFGEDGARTLQLGANPAGGNFLTIVDPANPQAALASIADNGVITAQSFLVAGSISYQGDELAQVFDALPRGLMTWGYRETGDYTTGMTGIMELEVAGQPGRMYRISHSACFVEPATPGTNPTTQGEMRLHYTLDGSRPTTSSAVLTTTGRSAPGDYGGLMANFGQVGVEAAAVRIRVLLTYQSHFGLSSRFITGGYSNGLLFWIEDVGTWEMPGGVSSAGAGTGATASATYRREWQATWARSWTNGGQDVRFSNGELVQGYFNDGTSGDQVSAFGFDDADIRASLAGATITSAELYLYAHHWYWNTGRVRDDRLGAVREAAGEVVFVARVGRGRVPERYDPRVRVGRPRRRPRPAQLRPAGRGRVGVAAPDPAHVPVGGWRVGGPAGRGHRRPDELHRDVERRQHGHDELDADPGVRVDGGPRVRDRPGGHAEGDDPLPGRHPEEREPANRVHLPVRRARPHRRGGVAVLLDDRHLEHGADDDRDEHRRRAAGPVEVRPRSEQRRHGHDIVDPDPGQRCDRGSRDAGDAVGHAAGDDRLSRWDADVVAADRRPQLRLRCARGAGRVAVAVLPDDSGHDRR
jgi:hypothetical protein